MTVVVVVVTAITGIDSVRPPEVAGPDLGEFRRVSGERHILYLTSYVRRYQANLVSNVSRDQACETRPWSCGLVSRLVSQGLTARRNSSMARKLFFVFAKIRVLLVCTYVDCRAFRRKFSVSAESNAESFHFLQ